MEMDFAGTNTTWKVTKYGVCISLHSDWIRRGTPYSVRVRGNTDQKKLHIWTLFTQCKFGQFKLSKFWACKIKLISFSTKLNICHQSLFYLMIFFQSFSRPHQVLIKIMQINKHNGLQTTNFFWTNK